MTHKKQRKNLLLMTLLSTAAIALLLQSWPTFINWWVSVALGYAFSHRWYLSVGFAVASIGLCQLIGTQDAWVAVPAGLAWAYAVKNDKI